MILFNSELANSINSTKRRNFLHNVSLRGLNVGPSGWIFPEGALTPPFFFSQNISHMRFTMKQFVSYCLCFFFLLSECACLFILKPMGESNTVLSAYTI